MDDWKEPDPETSDPADSDRTDEGDSSTVHNALENDDAGEMTPEQLAEAKEYGRRDLAAELIGRAVDFAYLLTVVFILGGPDGWLMRRLPGTEYPETLRLAVLMLILIVGNMLVSFPFSFYSGHLLEHRYKLSRQTFGGWLWRFAKRHLLEIAFALVLVPGLYWLIWITGAWWWLVAAVGFFLLSVVLGQLAPVLILPLFYKIEPLSGDEQSEELNERMERLADGTGLSIEGVFRMEMSAETSKANAMLTGLGRTRRVILGDTVLANFTPDEIEVIFAHEIGHHVCRHIRKMMVTGAIYSMIGFLACDWALRLWIESFGGSVDYATFPIYTLPMMLLVITLFSTALEPLQNGISRYFERQSDRYALTQTGLPEAYRSAFRKLARLNKDDPDPNRLEVFLFHSHPPIAERLAMAGTATESHSS